MHRRMQRANILTTCAHTQMFTRVVFFCFQYGRSDSYRVATTQDNDEKDSPKKKGGKDLDDLKREVPLVMTTFRNIWWKHLSYNFIHFISFNVFELKHEESLSDKSVNK